MQVYPTAVRSIALGMGSSLGRLGAMITPYIAQVSLAQTSQPHLVGINIFVHLETKGTVPRCICGADSSQNSFSLLSSYRDSRLGYGYIYNGARFVHSRAKSNKLRIFSSRWFSSSPLWRDYAFTQQQPFLEPSVPCCFPKRARAKN